MNNYRMWAYSMIAVGAINWDYQRNNSHVVTNSLLIVVPGLILIALTYLGFGKRLLQKRLAQISWIIIGAAALIFAFTNK